MRGGKAASIVSRLIETAKLNGIDPQGWLVDILAGIRILFQSLDIFIRFYMIKWYE